MFISLTDAYTDAIYINVSAIVAVQEWEDYREHIHSRIYTLDETFDVQENIYEVMEIICGEKSDRVFKMAQKNK